MPFIEQAQMKPLRDLLLLCAYKFENLTSFLSLVPNFMDTLRQEYQNLYISEFICWEITFYVNLKNEKDMHLNTAGNK